MDYPIARKKMIAELIQKGIRDPQVLESMARIPRHEFVDEGMASQAYLDRPVNIGLKQTISQPYIVARMTEALELNKRKKILEIGTGSGYQTAILAELCGQVCTIERISTLSNRARQRFYRLGYLNIKLRIGDGTLAWLEESPFDGIIVTAGSPEIPTRYQEQLTDGGILIIPVGSEDEQELVKLTRRGNTFQKEILGDCRFVKLYGEQGWQYDEAY